MNPSHPTHKRWPHRVMTGCRVRPIVSGTRQGSDSRGFLQVTSDPRGVTAIGIDGSRPHPTSTRHPCSDVHPHGRSSRTAVPGGHRIHGPSNTCVITSLLCNSLYSNYDEPQLLLSTHSREDQAVDSMFDFHTVEHGHIVCETPCPLLLPPLFSMQPSLLVLIHTMPLPIVIVLPPLMKS